MLRLESGFIRTVWILLVIGSLLCVSWVPVFYFRIKLQPLLEYLIYTGYVLGFGSLALLWVIMRGGAVFGSVMKLRLLIWSLVFGILASVLEWFAMNHFGFIFFPLSYLYWIILFVAIVYFGIKFRGEIFKGKP